MKLASKNLIALLSLPMLALGKVKRATPDSFRLYGYNRGSGGLPVFYADGK
jgi:hypothetical protein